MVWLYPVANKPKKNVCEVTKIGYDILEIIVEIFKVSLNAGDLSILFLSLGEIFRCP